MKEERINSYLASAGLVVGLLAGMPSAVAQQASSPLALPPAATDLAAVRVTGVQPGPGLWKVTRGDHVLWILGSLSPLPKDMTWQSRDVDAAIAGSQTLLGPPSAGIDVSFFKGLAVLPSLVGVRNNPDHATLEQELPADIYARWLPLKARYLGSSHAVEKRRPSIVADELYAAAIKQAGMTDGSLVVSAVVKIAKRHGLKMTPVIYKLPLDSPRAFVKDFKNSPMQESACFDHTLALVATSLGAMTARANAWAVGDIDALRKLPLVNMNVCGLQHMAPELLRSYHWNDIPAHIEATWLAAAQTALTSNKVSFAIVPIGDLIKANGYLKALQAQGDQVEQPE